MAHLHEKIDFTLAIFVVHGEKILLIRHRQLDKWLPLGGHIELDEDPEQAALREAKEESGLDVELLGERPPTTSPGTARLSRRAFSTFIASTPRTNTLACFTGRGQNGAATLPSPTLRSPSTTTSAGAVAGIWISYPRR